MTDTRRQVGVDFQASIPGVMPGTAQPPHTTVVPLMCHGCCTRPRLSYTTLPDTAPPPTPLPRPCGMLFELNRACRADLVRIPMRCARPPFRRSAGCSPSAGAADGTDQAAEYLVAMPRRISDPRMVWSASECGRAGLVMPDLAG